ncbi:MAG: DUF6636 domain-containing protein [Cypionkella sp.]|uniref:DUF6636 domain-containing protein n=1 Tax=Cypionkella sp. TaxID=2811411 RepID=UPI002ABCBE75|nr:DUF6636 domain-containing protein [Cypionkella sp.]MDZ4311857.1 DUF6636 domain-containing protein [Cypionkella sp.]MDZ4395441.1 DUF6636 domain-containing protein [Cypionkella sp.]
MIRLAFALTLLAAPAFADDYLAFHSPSGNIQCAMMTGDYAQVRCDMSSLTPTYRKAPANCEFDWGSSFAVDAGGQGYLACVSDAVADPGGIELGYGKSISLGPFTCTSEKSGMECTNLGGHGFKISKAKQKLF